jgi:ABC-type nitrate/sulfonate/bicarbonate transport system substrate-binding protein
MNKKSALKFVASCVLLFTSSVAVIATTGASAATAKAKTTTCYKYDATGFNTTGKAISDKGTSCPKGESKKKPVNLSGYTLTVADPAGAAQLGWTTGGMDSQLPSGFKIKFVNVATGPAAIATVVGGSAQLASEAEAAYVTTVDSGSPVSAVWTNRAIVPASGFQMLTNKAGWAAGITSASKIPLGSKIACAFGTESQYLAYKVIENANLAPENFTFVNLTPTNALAALASGAVTAAVMPQPNIDIAVAAYSAHIIADGSGILDGYSVTVMSNEDIQKNNPTEIAAIAEYLYLVTLAGKYWLQNPTVATNGLYTTYFSSVPSLANAIGKQAAADLYSTAGVGSVPMTAKVFASFQNQALFLYKAGVLQSYGNTNFASFFKPIFASLVPAVQKVYSGLSLNGIPVPLS